MILIVLRLRRPPPDWEQGICYGAADPPDDDPWFDNREFGYKDETGWARDVCNGDITGQPCPIREQCLLFALVNNELGGVWGGVSEADRKAMRRMWPWDYRRPAEPHPQWRWLPPGEAAAMLRARGIDTTGEEDDEDE